MGDLIHLDFKSPRLEDDFAALLSCKACKNKTFNFTVDQPEGGFPLMRCAACGQHIGRMGWVHDDDVPPDG